MRYHLFAGMDYYPDGGMMDYVGTYKTIAAAKQAFATPKKDDYGHHWNYQWGHIAEADGSTLRPLLYSSHRRKWCNWTEYWKVNS